jgi:hypothetical protein
VMQELACDVHHRHLGIVQGQFEKALLGLLGFHHLPRGFDCLVVQRLLDRNDAMLGCVENGVIGRYGSKGGGNILERGTEDGCEQRSGVLDDVGRQLEVGETLEGPFESLVG